jgi:hypothetical protein
LTTLEGETNPFQLHQELTQLHEQGNFTKKMNAHFLQQSKPINFGYSVIKIGFSATFYSDHSIREVVTKT